MFLGNTNLVKYLCVSYPITKIREFLDLDYKLDVYD